MIGRKLAEMSPFLKFLSCILFTIGVFAAPPQDDVSGYGWYIWAWFLLAVSSDFRND